MRAELPLERERGDRLGALRPEPDTEPRLLTREDHDQPRAVAPRPGRGRRFLRRLFGACLILALILSVLVAAGTIWSRHVMRAVLPTIDGTLSVDGLHSPVTVARNAQGVPSIHASSMEDLLFAQGYVTAQDRLWQMDTLRRHAAGELAEILGPGLVLHDEMQRYLQLRAAADRGAASLPPDQRRELEAYARGVNAFIDSHRDTTAARVSSAALHTAPMDAARLFARLARDVAGPVNELSAQARSRGARPSSSAVRCSPIFILSVPGAIIRRRSCRRTSRRRARSKRFLSTRHNRDSNILRISAKPEDLLALTSALATSSCNDCRAGSNNWAVSGDRTRRQESPWSRTICISVLVCPTSGTRLRCISRRTPGGAPALDVVGFTLPGLPWVIVGRNAHVAWSFTNLGGDVQDVRIEHTRGSGSNLQYEQPDGTWSPMQHHTEQIVVRGSHDVSLDVLTVSHVAGTAMMESPVITPMIPSEHRTISLAWTIYDPDITSTTHSSPPTARRTVLRSSPASRTSAARHST